MQNSVFGLLLSLSICLASPTQRSAWLTLLCNYRIRQVMICINQTGNIMWHVLQDTTAGCIEIWTHFKIKASSEAHTHRIQHTYSTCISPSSWMVAQLHRKATLGQGGARNITMWMICWARVSHSCTSYSLITCIRRSNHEGAINLHSYLLSHQSPCIDQHSSMALLYLNVLSSSSC